MANISNYDLEQSNLAFTNTPPLDTLAQLGKFTIESNVSAIINLQKRARSKWWTRSICLRLKYTVDEDDILRKMYSHAINCCDILKQDGQTIKSKFCNTRCCNVCNRIRTAKMYNGYFKQMASFERIEFVTLTIPNCSGDKLAETILDMYKKWIRIVDVFKKKGIKLNGIRKIEITYNVRTDTFHPHYHLLLEGSYGEQIVDEWLKRNPKASRKAQDFREAQVDSLNEIFKYTTKILIKNSKEKGSFLIISNAINTILRTMYGKRTMQPFGSIRKVSEDVDDVKSQEYDVQEETMWWGWEDCDWVSMYGEKKRTLTGYINPEVDFILIE